MTLVGVMWGWNVLKAVFGGWGKAQGLTMLGALHLSAFLVGRGQTQNPKPEN